MTCVLKDLIEVSKDGEWGKGEPSEESVEMLCIRGTDFEDVRFGDTFSTPHRHIRSRIAERKKLQPWDVLIEAAGGTKGQITGRTVLLRPQLFSRSELPITCASFSRFIRFKTDLCDPQFMFWYLQHLYHAGFMHPYHTQHTGVARFQWTTFSEREPLQLPSLPVQRRIAGILSAYDELIENNQRRIKILEEMARSLYREWFVHFRFPGHDKVKMVASSLGSIPQGWEVKSLAELIEIRGGSQPPKSEFIYEHQPGYVRLIQIRDYETDSHLTFVRESSNLRLCNRADIMIARYGASVARICWGLRGAYNVALIKVIPLIKNCQEYLRQFLSDEEFQKLLIGMSGRAAQNGFNKSDIAAIRVPFPNNHSLLERFEQFAVPLRDTTLTLRDQTENLRRTRDLLLPRLLSGYIEIQDADSQVGKGQH